MVATEGLLCRLAKPCHDSRHDLGSYGLLEEGRHLCVEHPFSIEVPLVAHRSHPGAAAPSIQRRQRRIVQVGNAAETASESLCMDLGLVHRGQNGIIHLFGELQIPFCSCKPFASHALLSALLKALQGVREGHDNQPAREQQEMPSHSSAVRRERAADTCLQKPQNIIKLWWQEKYHWERYCCAELGQGSALRLC